MPGHLFKKLPPLFSDLIDAASNERHGVVTGFFVALERNNSRTFAGFPPTDDLIDDLSHIKLAPPKAVERNGTEASDPWPLPTEASMT